METTEDDFYSQDWVQEHLEFQSKFSWPEDWPTEFEFNVPVIQLDRNSVF